MEEQIDLRSFDGKPVRLRDTFGDVYEGIASWESSEYNFHEYGHEEEGLMLGVCLFYRSDIEEISILNEAGPYAPFSSAWGTLEEVTAKSGTDLLEEVLDMEEEITVLRMLGYLNEALDPAGSHQLEDREAVIALIRNRLDGFASNRLKEEALHILERWG